MQASIRRRCRSIIMAGGFLVSAVALLPGPGVQAADRTTASDDPVVVAAGDFACQTLTSGEGTATCQSGAVADLIRRIDPDRFLALGDLQYNNGKLSEFLRVWDVQFGDLKPITKPIPGNHEYGTPDAAGYFTYFGARAHPPHGYYSFDVENWHVVALNDELCGDDHCANGTPQHEWLEQDLANSDAECTLAMIHHPRYDWRPWQKWVDVEDQTPNGGTSVDFLVPLWRVLHGAGVEAVLNGDNHLYQRWAPQDADGNRVAGGTIQFTVGTGGRLLYSYGIPPRPENLLVTQNEAFGVLKLTLHEDSYTYAWRSAPGQPRFVDRGTVACS
jgi:Calcineurin-like phosphoesterase